MADHRIEWLDEWPTDPVWTGSSVRFTCERTDFVCTFAVGSTANRFMIMKPPWLVESYAALLAALESPRIVELGINQGGSAALIALLAEPRLLVAVELDDEPIEALTEFIHERGVEASVRPYYGVDQADRVGLSQIVADEFGGEPIDVVFDDASHFLDETRSSFETLFPLLRPGGRFVIEDWNWQHINAEGLERMVADPEQNAEGREAFDRALERSLLDPSAPGHAAAWASVHEAANDPHSPSHELARKVEAARVERNLSVGSLATLAIDGRPPEQRPLTRLVMELMLVVAGGHPAISSVSIAPQWIIVTRGAAELDPASFRLGDLYRDHFHQLPNS